MKYHTQQSTCTLTVLVLLFLLALVVNAVLNTFCRKEICDGKDDHVRMMFAAQATGECRLLFKRTWPLDDELTTHNYILPQLNSVFLLQKMERWNFKHKLNITILSHRPYQVTNI